MQSQITGVIVDLGTGNTEKIRDNRNFFLPTIGYEFGREINNRLNWYSKWSYGYRISSKHLNVSMLFIELGLTFDIPLKSKTNE